MKKIVSIGLFTLLAYHTLAYVLVAVAGWWQAEHDLSERLLVYRSVDSLVEFDIPFKDKQEINTITQATSDGFTYHGHYYSVVTMEVQGKLLHIAGLETESRSFWQHDLLSFLNEHITGASKSNQKANQLLKLLLKEYSLTSRTLFSFRALCWQEAIRIPAVPFVVSVRALPVHSPPPESYS